DKRVDTGRIDHGAGEDMGADFRSLFEDDYGHVRRDLLQTDRGGDAGRACSHHDHIKIHRLALFVHCRQLPLSRGVPSTCRRCADLKSLMTKLLATATKAWASGNTPDRGRAALVCRTSHPP